jgi:hypothetical protein
MSTGNLLCRSLLTIAVVAAFLTLPGLSPAEAASMVSGYNIYYGHLHNHSNLSDGTGSPSTAYSTARAAGLDFFGLSDHSDSLSTTSYQSMIDAADTANRDGTFVAFYGFEWSSGAYGHVTVVNCSEYCTTGSAPNFDALLTWLNSHGGVAFCNHPGRQDGSGTEFDHFTDPPGPIVGMELWNKSSGFSTYYYNNGYTSDGRDRSGYFDDALLNGWTLGAAGSLDNHTGEWGSGRYRLAVLAGSRTRTSIYTALQERRFYSTLDENLELSFTVNGSEMGSSTAGGATYCEIRAADRDAETFSKIEVIQNGYVVYTETVIATNPVVTCDLTTQSGDYVYCKVTESDGDEAISSPVFVTSSGPDGPPRADLLVPLDNGPADLDSAPDQVTVNTTQANFRIQLTDHDGVNDGSVTAATLAIAGLTSGTDYSFSYDGGTDIITLTPLAGPVFGNGVYTITLSGIRDLADEVMSATALTVQIDTSIVAPQTLRFQQGLNGYSGTADTMICAGTPDTSYGSDTSLNADTASALGGVSQVLLRFDSIIGAATDQIPPGASISAATLRLNSLDTGNGGGLHAMLRSWSGTSTWNSLVNGVSADNVEALSSADGNIGANNVGDVDFNVTSTVQSWVNGTMANNGWVVLPNGSDGWHIASAEYSPADYRPELIVTFVAGGDLSPVADAGPDQTVADDDGDTVEIVTLSAAGSYHPDPDAYITGYTWTWNVNGTPYMAAGSVVNASFPVGSRVVTLTVTDNLGATDTDTATITVNANQPPTARAGADQTVVDTDNDGFATITLDGSKSTDPDGSIALYEWTVDSQPVSDPEGDGVVTITLPLGDYTAQLEVTDNGGLWATDTAALKVEAPSLFSDGFESGGFIAGGWSAGGLAGVDPTAAHTGAYGALLKKTSSIERSIASGGATAASFTYWARIDYLKNGRLYVEWSANGGAWQPLNTLTSGTSWASFSHSLSPLSPSFSIRFRTDGASANEVVMVDDIRITATAGNGLPVAGADWAVVDEDASVTVEVLANDSDPDGDALTVTGVSQPAHGSALINPDSTVTYRPVANYCGSDSFTYTVSDDKGGTDSAVVSVTIDPVNDDPVARDDTATTPQDAPVTILVLNNDSDVDGDTLTVSTAGGAAHGTVTNDGGSVLYAPSPGYAGPDSFTYTVSDGHGGTATAAVTVTVTGATPPPVSVQSITLNVMEGKKYRATAFVMLNPPLDGATVVGDWYFKGTLRARDIIGTPTNGGYAFPSPETPAKPGDEFKFVVTDVRQDGYQFAPDPDKDVATIVVTP